MIYKVEKRDLFSVDDSYYIAHCISADFAFGTGIAKEIDKRFNTREELRKKYPNFYGKWAFRDHIANGGTCLLAGRILNLVTKDRYYEKPTYRNLCHALTMMFAYCKTYNIKKIAMPLIGCGSDRLQWDRVSAMIKEIFADEDIEILVCRR